MKKINTMEELLEVFGLKDKNQMTDYAWHCASTDEILSENFIEQYANNVDWYDISKSQILSESFIKKHQHYVDWNLISEYQKLSEDFIQEFSDFVNWGYISVYQKLSESFIERHKYKVNWYCISMYQKLSEPFIEKHKENLDMDLVHDSWHYKSTAFKRQAVVDTGLYECHDDYFIAYKGIRSDRYSNFNFQYQYLPNQTYETFADYSDNEYSFGFSVGDYENAKGYCDELVVKVKIYYQDVARVVHNGNKIRACKITVLE